MPLPHDLCRDAGDPTPDTRIPFRVQVWDLGPRLLKGLGREVSGFMVLSSSWKGHIMWEFPKIRATLLFGVLIIRILLFRVLS